MRALHGPTLEDDRGRYGNALLTRLEVREIRRVDLSVPGFEPRGGLDVELDAGQPMRVLATHLGLARRERIRQAERLLAVLEGASTLPTLLLGDLNEWLPSRLGFRRLRRRLRPAPARPTFPARRALLALDRVWLSAECELVSVAGHRSPLARVASDHLPLCARVGL
jgi:endonuclease/exonuclease/phosphatase family metal-dependent hydrolase